MPNLSTFKAKFRCSQVCEDIACSLAFSNHLQHLELLLIVLWDNTPNGVFLRGNPRLLVAGTERLTGLHVKLKEMGVSYELAPERFIDCLLWGEEFVPVLDRDHVLTEIYDI